MVNFFAFWVWTLLQQTIRSYVGGVHFYIGSECQDRYQIVSGPLRLGLLIFSSIFLVCDPFWLYTYWGWSYVDSASLDPRSSKKIDQELGGSWNDQDLNLKILSHF